MTRLRALALAAPAIAVVMALAGCASLLHPAGPPPPPPRPTVAAGPGYSAEMMYLAAHKIKPPKGMQVGILVSSSSPGWASQNLNGGNWTGVAVIPGGFTVELASDAGDSGMAGYIHPGDLFEFPAGDIPVDAPGDSVINGGMARLLTRAVVTIP
jgi:hypothetical protein